MPLTALTSLFLHLFITSFLHFFKKRFCSAIITHWRIAMNLVLQKLRVYLHFTLNVLEQILSCFEYLWEQRDFCRFCLCRAWKEDVGMFRAFHNIIFIHLLFIH